MYDANNKQTLEKYSSAITLSDMEIFIFPQLLYALVLANIMSPRIWRWRNDPWFSKLPRMNPARKVQRLKQFIMDHFSFNLDLDTWGLTTKDVEIKRFNHYINESVLAESNALFGYEGDKYYFDIDIRKHFGMDRYTSDIIPYWKTETVEAMEAFQFKQGYPNGAGECVSLATLYAAAAFVVTGIPLESIYLYATPLHSQNYLDIGKGILTNNRRIVTKNMWFNGTELSAKARRALENERVTLVAHQTGHIHTLYDQATIDKKSYLSFVKALTGFLSTPVTYEILANFLRQHSRLQSCFQLEHSCCGKPRYIEAEKVYHYEHSSKARVGDATQTNLLHEIEEDEYYTQPLPKRLMLSELETFFKGRKLPVDEKTTVEKLKEHLQHHCYNVDAVVHDLIRFCRTTPRLPEEGKRWSSDETVIELDGLSTPEAAVDRLEQLRKKNTTVDLAFSAYRDLNRSPWKPFLKAAMERNPVAVEATRGESVSSVYKKLIDFTDASIYDGPFRLAQPDEVWNFQRGDGLEKALCFMNILKNNFTHDTVTLDWDASNSLSVRINDKSYRFSTDKKMAPPELNDFSFAAD